MANKNISSEKGVAQIEIQIVDEDGKPVYIADNEITCETSGPIKLLGLEASNTRDISNYTDNKLRVFNGKMIAYLQSTGETGKAKITLSSPWLTETIVDLYLQ